MIKELKTLVAVAREGSFAAAGAQLGLTQAAVSAQMQRLESNLGVTLFERSGRSARINVKGQQLLQQAQQLLAIYQTLGHELKDQDNPRQLKIGSIASIQHALLTPVLADFYQKFTQCNLQITPGVSANLLNEVDSGAIELAAMIRPPFALDTNLNWIELAKEPFELITARTHDSNDWLRWLSEEPFIRYHRASYGGRQIEQFLIQMRIKVHDICETDELESITDLVAQGLGIALVPKTRPNQKWPKGIRAIQLGHHQFYREIGILHRFNPLLSAPAKYLIELLSANSFDKRE
ncbi:LysR family transcriptional regulator [Celerinatantimonas sp. MCCC 1A17872]|uniref:LysR family transcriptional regulator n=1 Tax=Celerinatantimonas sp. MCCC 1A17872 TaxID=3177514 RepID=UPI0038C293DE